MEYTETRQMTQEELQTKFRELSREMAATQLIRKHVRQIAMSGDFGQAVHDMLASVGDFVNAERMYIFEDQGDLYPNTCEWCAEGIGSEIDTMRTLTRKDIASLLRYLEKGEAVLFPDVEKIKETDPEIYAILTRQNIRSAIEVPIMTKDCLIGFMGVDNAPQPLTALIVDSLTTLASFLGVAVQMRREREKTLRQNMELKQEKKRYREALSNRCEYYYTFDVTEGLIREEFVTAHGVNIFQSLGLSLPVSYEEMNRKFISTYHVEILDSDTAPLYTCEGLREQFRAGVTNVESEYYSPLSDVYSRVTTLLSEDEVTGHIHAVVIATDTTETRKREFEKLHKAVHEKEQLKSANDEMALQLETILNGINGGFKISRDDKEHTLEYVSEGIAALQGYTPEELIRVSGGSALSNCYELDRKRVKEEIRKQYASGDSYLLKFRVRHKDGSLKWVLDNGMRVADDEGVVRHYSFYQDVTELEEQHMALRDTYEMQRQMIASISCGVFAYMIAEKKLLFINDVAKRIMECNDSDPLADLIAFFKDAVLPEDLRGVSDMQQRLRNPGDRVQNKFRVRKSDGNIAVVECHMALLQFADGQRYLLCSMLDVTRQTNLEIQLTTERGQYRNALLADAETTLSMDLTGGHLNGSIRSNKGRVNLEEVGLSKTSSYDEVLEQWTRRRRLALLPENDESILHGNLLLKRYERGESRFEADLYSAEYDQYYHVLVLLSKSQEDGHIHAIFVGYNTTDTKKREMKQQQALKEAYNAANRANDAKTKFLASMSHDIRTPMNAIIGMTAIAGTHLDDRERVIDCLGKITVSSKHLLGLINEVLDMSKIESGKLDLNEEAFSLSELLDNLLVMIKPQINAKNHELNVSIRSVEHERVIGDSQRLQQAFMNLLSNSIKYTPEGGKISFTITEKPMNKPKLGCFEFVFEDNGIGMEKEFIDQLFEPFARATDDRVQETQGTGLGMAITKNMIQMMNGKIQAESELDKGTRITITLVMKLQNAEETISYDAFMDLPILVVDDDEMACETTCQVLGDLGMKGEWVLSGQEAVKLVVARHEEDNDFFAVIVDWKMPGVDGIETTKELRRRVGKEVPIIILSAYDWSDIELEARAAGANAFISKPLFKSRMARLFQDLMGDSKDETGAYSLDSIIKQDFNDCRALLVEDNELNAEIAEEILRMAGLDVDIAKDGKEALDRMAVVEDDFYDIVFMDIQMPVMNGYDATVAIRSLPGDYVKRVPIIAMTANAFSEDILAAKNAGMNQHMAKPLDFNHLMEVLRKWIRG